MVLNGKEIKELAQYAEFLFNPVVIEDVDLEYEYSVIPCPESGTAEQYKYTVTCVGRLIPLGDKENIV